MKKLKEMSDEIANAIYTTTMKEAARRMLLDWLLSANHLTMKDTRVREVENAKTLVAIWNMTTNFKFSAEGMGLGQSFNWKSDGRNREFVIAH